MTVKADTETAMKKLAEAENRMLLEVESEFSKLIDKIVSIMQYIKLQPHS